MIDKLRQYIIPCILLLILLVLAGWFSYLPLSNPELTNTQVFLKYWYHYLIGFIVAISLLFASHIDEYHKANKQMAQMLTQIGDIADEALVNPNRVEDRQALEMILEVVRSFE